MACVLEAGEGAVALERQAQRIDALVGVGANAHVVDAAERVVKEAANKCTQRVGYWALTKDQRLGGGGALEVCDLRLIENGSECGGALDSDLILSEAVSERGGRGTR